MKMLEYHSSFFFPKQKEAHDAPTVQKENQSFFVSRLNLLSGKKKFT
jgi:hypothetical protein